MNLTWRAKGACRGLDPVIFYPVSEDDAVEAKRVCGMCSVNDICLEYALVNRERDGVWGGATEKERRRMLRQRRKTA
jgi:WhiB family redox-sensing transcriptional regulator